MKKLFFLLLAFTVFTQWGCQNNDDDLSVDDIVGTWDVTVFKVDITSSTETIGTVRYILNYSNITYTLTFNANGTWTSTGDATLVFTEDGQTTTTVQTGGLGSGTYSVANGKLTINNLEADPNAPPSSNEFEVLLFEPGAKLDLYHEQTKTQVLPIVNLNNTSTLKMDMKLER